MKRRALRGGVCGLAAALAITACSSSTSSSPGTTAPAAAATASTAGTAARGSPIGLIFLSQDSSRGSTADGWTGIQSAVTYVNAHGGIHGRTLTATECVDNGDPNLAAACAAKVSGSPDIIASVGQATLQGSVVDPVFGHDGLPIIGANAFVPADFTSQDIFAMEIGGLSGLGAVAAAADLLHARKISFVYDESPAAATEIALLNSVVLKPRGLPPINAVGVPNTAGDMSAAVAEASQGSPSAIIMYTSQAHANSFVKAARQQGVQAPILISAALETPSAVKQQLGGGQNLYFYTEFNHSGQFYDDFLAQWQAAGNSPSLVDDFAIDGWLSVTMFTAIARTLPDVTRASVMQAFSKLSGYSTDGLLPSLSFDKSSTFLGGKVPRIVNATMALSSYQNGAFVPVAGGRFTNPFVAP